MLDMELGVQNLLKKLQESTTEDIDEERGSFKKGDSVIYNMSGIGFTNSDLIRMLGIDEHAMRVNHDGVAAKIVEAVGEEVARYSILFEDGFVINDVAASELKSVKEDKKDDLVDIANAKLGRAVAEQLKSILADITINGIEDAELNINAVRMIYRFVKDRSEYDAEAREVAEVIEEWVEEGYGDPDVLESKLEETVSTADVKKLFKSIDSLFAKHLTGLYGTKKQIANKGLEVGLKLSAEGKKVVEESKTNEAEDATDTMQPQEKPDIKAEDYHMEDYSEEDLNKPEVKVKSKSEKSGDAIRQVEDDELEQKEDKVVTPKKESKLKEAKDVIVSITGGDDEGKPGVVKNWVKGLGYQDVNFEGRTKQISYEYLSVGDKSAEEFDKGVGAKESKLKEEGTEFTPSRSEMSKVTDDKLRELHKNALRSLAHWEKDVTAQAQVALTRKAITRYEEEMVDRGLLSKDKKESKYSFMKKQEPLWICNECYKTFRSNKSVCTLCESEEVERIVEQTAGFTKEVFQVTWKNTDTGKEESTRVMAFDKADAKKEAARPNREVTKAEGPITEEPKEESRVPFDQKESELREGVQELVGEVPGIDKEEQEMLLKAIKDGTISNEWPTDEEMVDALVKAGVESEIASDSEAEDFKVAYIKHFLLTKVVKAARAAKESKVNEQEDWDLTFQYEHNLIWHNPLRDKDGVPVHWQKRPTPGTRIRVFTDYQAKWVERNKGVPVMAEFVEERVEEAKKGIPTSTSIEIVRSSVDPDAWIFRAVELPSGSTVNLSTSEGSEKEAIKKGKEMARGLGAQFLGIVSDKKAESKLKENIFKLSDEELEKLPLHELGQARETAWRNYRLGSGSKGGQDWKDVWDRLDKIVKNKMGESKLKEQEEDRKDEFHKGYDYAKLTREAHLDLKIVLDLIEPHSSKEFRRGYMEYLEENSENESKLKEQEEDTFQTVVKGIVAKTLADEIAAKENGQVVTDEDDDKKFMVIVKAE